MPAELQQADRPPPSGAGAGTAWWALVGTLALGLAAIVAAAALVGASEAESFTWTVVGQDERTNDVVRATVHLRRATFLPLVTVVSVILAALCGLGLVQARTDARPTVGGRRTLPLLSLGAAALTLVVLPSVVGNAWANDRYGSGHPLVTLAEGWPVLVAVVGIAVMLVLALRPGSAGRARRDATRTREDARRRTTTRRQEVLARAAERARRKD